jgi:hypothetical protein
METGIKDIKIKVVISRVEAYGILKIMASTITDIHEKRNKNIADFFAIERIGRKLYSGFDREEKKSKKMTLRKVEAVWLYNYLQRVEMLPIAIVDFMVQMGKYAI